MAKFEKNDYLLEYSGKNWLRFTNFPDKTQEWSLDRKKSLGNMLNSKKLLHEAVQQSTQHCEWKWPENPVYFFADPHADADAFLASLVASGGIKKTGAADHDFVLTEEGKNAIFVLGGDCFDKGPDNLRLLRCIISLKSIANVKLLAGNHDLRMFMGIHSVFKKRDPRTEHFFIRMDAKAVPLLKEVYEQYLDNKDILNTVPSSEECKQILFPSKKWFDEFPTLAQWTMSDAAVEREVARIREKLTNLKMIVKKPAYRFARSMQQFLNVRNYFSIKKVSIPGFLKRCSFYTEKILFYFYMPVLMIELQL